MQARAAEDLKRLVCDGLKKAGLAFDKAEAFVTPRRLTLVVDGLPDKQPDVTEEKRGPRVDAPEKAIHGFLGSVGLTLDQVEKRETGKGEFYFAVIERKGAATADVLANLLPVLIPQIPWPKSMRWSDKPFRWVRPLHNILAIFNGRALKAGFYGLQFRMTTFGHRFLDPGPLTVKSFADYKARLKKAKVLVDPAERKAKILKDAEKRAQKAGLVLKDDPALLAEVTGLVEWPVVLMGRIDAAFMDLWADVLTTVMRHHQKYFALLDRDGNIAPRFIFVADNVARDRGKEIIAGNERVLRARLADAKFFRDQDLSEPLESYVPRLNNLVFHAKLGSVADKTERIAKLARKLAGYANADPSLAERAARLCKADLVTQMVGEFPELQGIMGGRYAYYGPSQEDPAVAAAIKEHYSPLGPNDTCPSAPVSVAVALADKIDSLVGFFAIGEKSTGSKDPFALRRAALGAIRLIIENRLRVPLTKVFRNAAENVRIEVPAVLGATGGRARLNKMDRQRVAADLLDFFADRLKVALKDSGVRHDLISAVFAVRQTQQELLSEVYLLRVLARVEALGKFLDTDDGANLLVAYRRAANIVRIEEKRDGETFQPAVYDPAFAENEELALWNELKRIMDGVRPLLDEEEFGKAMSLFAQLRKPVDTFFDRVTVNVESQALRRNRLCLLAYIVWVMNQVADFSRIEGGER